MDGAGADDLGDELENARLWISEETSDDDIDQALAASHQDPVIRDDETAPIAEMLADLTGDPAWASSYSAELSQLDWGGQGLLEVEEKRQLLRSLSRFYGEEGFTFEQVINLMQWANKTRAMNDLLELVLAGELDAGWDEEQGDLVVRLPDADGSD